MKNGEIMKILHITYHDGCKKTIDFVCKELGHEVHTQYANWNYNIGHNRAKEIWDTHKDYYNSFDIIITSDTCPLSRIFLQNDYKSKLIIWVCNRFDYTDCATNDCNFPDLEYYNLIRQIKNKNNVKIYSYSKFEYEYAQKYRNVNFGNEVIKPSAFIEDSVNTSFQGIDKSSLFFIPPYHNDTIFINLKDKCDQLGIPSYCGRYKGPSDLKGFKGIIHIPYAWSNLALFENWSIGNVYFIPSRNFLLNLASQHNFWWPDSFALKDLIESSEWYLPEHNDNFIFFENWNDLQRVSKETTLINDKKNIIHNFNIKHCKKTLAAWNCAFNNWPA